MGRTSQTETKLELKGVHLCCDGCTDAVYGALEGLEGVEAHCDKGKGTVTLSAGNAGTMQAALDAIAAAGFHGDSGDDRLAMKLQSDIPQGRVKSLRVSAIHNCCWPCCKAIKEAIKTVDGVTGDTAAPGETAFKVTGDFEATSLLKARNDAGFNAGVEA